MKYFQVTMLAVAVCVLTGVAFAVRPELQMLAMSLWNKFWHLPQRDAILACVAVILIMAMIVRLIKPNVTRKGFYE